MPKKAQTAKERYGAAMTDNERQAEYGAAMTDNERRGGDRRKSMRREKAITPREAYGASMTKGESSKINKPKKKKTSASNQGGASVGGGT